MRAEGPRAATGITSFGLAVPRHAGAVDIADLDTPGVIAHARGRAIAIAQRLLARGVDRFGCARRRGIGVEAGPFARGERRARGRHGGNGDSKNEVTDTHGSLLLR